MKKIKHTILTLIIAFIILSSITSFSTAKTNIENTSSKIFHKPISITNNNDFTLKNGVITGEGVKENPFIISGWKINSYLKPAIQISNTDSYVEIFDCEILGNKIFDKFGIGAVAGIIISNAKNVCIKNTNIHDLSSDFGIAIIASSNNTVDNCVFKNIEAGITINGCPFGEKKYADNNTIKNSYFSNCQDAIYFCCLPISKNNLIYNCNFSDNNRSICLDHCIHYTMITGCNISNSYIGVSIISASSNNYVSNNIFYNNTIHATDNCENYWDNGEKYGGNFWQGHNPMFAYNITGCGDNKDCYPLKNDSLKANLIALYLYEPKTVFTDQNIVFDASPSFEIGKNISCYKWDFGDQTPLEYGRKASHSYTEPGVYNITLNISNEQLSDEFTRKITVYGKSDDTIIVENNDCIQNAIDLSEPGDTIIIKNGTYYENLEIDKPGLKIIGENNVTVDGRKKDHVINISMSYVNISGLIITNSSENKSGIIIGNPDYVLDSISCNISNNIITKNYVGISLYESKRNLIKNNKIFQNNKYGIFGIRSFHNIISHNEISKENIGIRFEYASNWNEINNNTIMNCSIGLSFKQSHYAKIFENIIKQNNIGLKLYKAINPKIQYNNIFSNKDYGLIYINTTLDAKHNWWGSVLGPSGILKIFGDRLVQTNDEGKYKLFNSIKKYIVCFPWKLSPDAIS